MHLDYNLRRLVEARCRGSLSRVVPAVRPRAFSNAASRASVVYHFVFDGG